MLVNRTEMPFWEKKPESTSTVAGPTIPTEFSDMPVSSSDVMEDSGSEAEAATCFACPRCGKILTPGSRFCRYCGEKL